LASVASAIGAAATTWHLVEFGMGKGGVAEVWLLGQRPLELPAGTRP
jgi:hypothetical protein